MAEPVVSWCDKLASTPAAGFVLNPDYLTVSTLMDVFTPTFNNLTEGEKALFTIDQVENFKLVWTTNSGVQTAIEPTKVAASFVHRLRAKTVSGGPPILEMQSKPQPYTKMLPFILDAAVHATLKLPEVKKRTISRVGIVTSTSVDLEEAPPGIRKILQYMSNPWGKLVAGFHFAMTAEINEHAQYTERCIHTLALPEGDDALLNLTFDFQRILKKDRPVSEENLEELTKDCQKHALGYFEELAEGNRF